MKTNRQVIQYIEGCSKEGINYLSTPVTAKPIGYYAQNTLLTKTIDSHESTQPRHQELKEEMNSFGISFDSPYKNIYLKFKSSPTPSPQSQLEVFQQTQKTQRFGDNMVAVSNVTSEIEADIGRLIIKSR
jgi:hypothetical protein